MLNEIARLVLTVIATVIALAGKRDWRYWSLAAIAVAVFLLSAGELWQRRQLRPDHLREKIHAAVIAKDYETLEKALDRADDVSEVRDSVHFGRGILLSQSTNTSDPLPHFNIISPANQAVYLAGQERAVDYLIDRYSGDQALLRQKLRDVVERLESAGHGGSPFASYVQALSVDDSEISFADAQRTCSSIHTTHSNLIDPTNYQIRISASVTKGGNAPPRSSIHPGKLFRAFAAMMRCNLYAAISADREGRNDERDEAVEAIQRIAALYPRRFVEAGFGRQRKILEWLEVILEQRYGREVVWNATDGFDIGVSMTVHPERGVDEAGPASGHTK